MGRRGRETRRAIGRVFARKSSRFARPSPASYGWGDIPTVAARRACSQPKRLDWWMDYCCFPILCIRLENRPNCVPPIFPSSQTPALFVHGSRDPFGSFEELQKAIALIPAETRLIELEGAGHELGRDHAGLAKRIVAALCEWA